MSEQRDQLDKGSSDPAAYAIVFVLSACIALFGAAVAYYQEGWNTRDWLFWSAIAATATVALLILVLKLPHMTQDANKYIRRYCWFLIIIPVGLAVGWLFAPEPSGQITMIGNVNVDDSDDSVCADKPEFEFKDQFKDVEDMCLLHATAPNGDTRRPIDGTARHVSKHLWLEVLIPPQTYEKEDIQTLPQWYYTPVFKYGGENWRSFATLGIPEDTTPKTYSLRLIQCSDAASRRILQEAYLPQQMKTSSGLASKRASYQWGDECDEKALETLRIDVSTATTPGP